MRVYRELSSNKIIGLREIKSYLNKKTSLIEAKELIAQKTRQYAKRQLTWARGHMKSWEMIDSSDINDIFKKTINKIS
jgi:tRNA dimethylallyltransferase